MNGVKLSAFEAKELWNLCILLIDHKNPKQKIKSWSKDAQEPLVAEILGYSPETMRNLFGGQKNRSTFSYEALTKFYQDYISVKNLHNEDIVRIEKWHRMVEVKFWDAQMISDISKRKSEEGTLEIVDPEIPASFNTTIEPLPSIPKNIAAAFRTINDYYEKADFLDSGDEQISFLQLKKLVEVRIENEKRGMYSREVYQKIFTEKLLSKAGWELYSYDGNQIIKQIIKFKFETFMVGTSYRNIFFVGLELNQDNLQLLLKCRLDIDHQMFSITHDYKFHGKVQMISSFNFSLYSQPDFVIGQTFIFNNRCGGFFCDPVILVSPLNNQERELSFEKIPLGSKSIPAFVNRFFTTTQSTKKNNLTSYNIHYTVNNFLFTERENK